MRFEIKPVTAVLLTAGILASCLCGCTSNGNYMQRIGQNNTTKQRGPIISQNKRGTTPNAGTTTNPPGNIIGRVTSPNPNGLQQSVPMRLANFDRAKAINISRQLAGIPGIKELSTVVRGDTVLIGVRPIDGTTDMNALKTAISNKVKQVDGTLKNVVVTGSDDVHNGINQLSMDLTSNKPIADLQARFDQLLQRAKNAG